MDRGKGHSSGPYPVDQTADGVKIISDGLDFRFLKGCKLITGEIIRTKLLFIKADEIMNQLKRFDL